MFEKKAPPSNRPWEPAMMILRFNFERKIRLFFLSMVVMITFMASTSLLIFDSITKTQNTVTNDFIVKVLFSQETHYLFERLLAKSRQFIITGNVGLLEEYKAIHSQFLKSLEYQKQHINTAKGLALYADSEKASQQILIDMKHLQGNRKPGPLTKEIASSLMEKAGVLFMPRVHLQLAASYDIQQFKDAFAASSERSKQGIFFLVATVIISIVFLLVFYWFLNKLLWKKKETDEKLFISNTVLKQAMIVGNFGIFDHNQRTDKIDWSAEFRNICGWSSDQIVTLADWIGHMPVEEQGATLTAIQRAHNPDGDGRYTIEHRIIHSDGTFRWVKIMSQTFFEGPVANRSPTRTIGAMLDITHKKKLELELTAAKETAEAANLAKSSFLANMSHEIRTPLGAVLGFAELITDPNVGPSQAANYIAAIKRNSELLSNIINDILDLSKIEANKMKVIFQEVALAEILTDSKILLDLQAKEKGIILNIALDDNLPEIIRTDPLRLRQTLINIIGNAIKFTSKGSVDVSIHLKSVTDGHYFLEFVIKDSGLGISQDQVEKLFAPFSQGDITSKRKYGGTGLGLVISKRFANLLGGDVVLAQTELGKGSTFSITIDPGVIHSKLTAKKNEPEVTAFQGASLSLDGIKVLLVEDSPDNQMLISRLLKLAGATVETASDGKEAVETANKNNYDVLLMDLQMPVMDGYEATAMLRKEGYNGRIIALTAHALNEERERCLKSGFDDHLSKPINRELLIQRVEYWARQKKRVGLK